MFNCQKNIWSQSRWWIFKPWFVSRVKKSLILIKWENVSSDDQCFLLRGKYSTQHEGNSGLGFPHEREDEIKKKHSSNIWNYFVFLFFWEAKVETVELHDFVSIFRVSRKPSFSCRRNVMKSFSAGNWFDVNFSLKVRGEEALKILKEKRDDKFSQGCGASNRMGNSRQLRKYFVFSPICFWNLLVSVQNKNTRGNPKQPWNSMKNTCTEKVILKIRLRSFDINTIFFFIVPDL